MAEPGNLQIVGIDLAWGEHKGDGLCLIEAARRRAEVRAFGYAFGDDALLRWLEQQLHEGPALLLIDAPIVCPNLTGTRPVDRLTHRMFHREHAACHPANLGKCPRPVRVAAQLVGRGFRIGWELGTALRLVAEVYPHPAMVRLFELDRIVKYKRGRVRQKRVEFRRLQQLLRRCLERKFPRLGMGGELRGLLRAGWTKEVEDKTDAFFCALIGYHHWLHAGRRSEVIGDLETGFILLPAAPRPRVSGSATTGRS